MSRSPEAAADLPRLLCGGALVTLLASLPAAMSLSTTRGFVLMKFAIGLPLCCMAAASAVWMLAHRADRSPAFPDARVENVALATLLIAIVVSTLQADPWQTALLGGYFRLEGALAWLAYLGAYLATRAWIRAGGGALMLVDAMLIASIAPAAYAVGQRFGLDFVRYTYGDPSRSAGTMGNPMFMGAYLAMCVPLALVRMGMLTTTARHRLALGLIAALAVAGLLATRGRSPLLALAAALALLACMQAYRQRRRRWLGGLLVSGLFVATVLAAINVTERGKAFAQTTPVLSRLVHDTRGEDPASKSVRGRLAAWQAGESALRAAGPWRLLTGFGPDVAHENFYAHMPVEKIRAEDFRREQVTDRVHADLLDTTAALGLLGMTAIAALMAMALRRLAREIVCCSAPEGTLSVGVGAIAATAAWLAADLAGASALRWPLGGMAFATGWLLAVAGFAWRGAGQAGGERDGDGMLLAAGAGAALLAFWVDAQVGLPVFVTRLQFFVLLAVVLTPANASAVIPADATHRWLGCAAFVAAWLSAVTAVLPSFGSTSPDMSPSATLARLIPVLCLWFLGRWPIAPTGSRPETGRLPWRAVVVGAVGVACLRYAIALPGGDQDWIAARAMAEAMLPALMWALPVCVVLLAGWQARRRAGGVAAIALASVLATAWPVWRLTVANVAGAGSTRVDEQNGAARQALLRVTLEAAPWEWQYRYALVFDALSAASNEVARGFSDADGLRRFRGFLDLAESTARDGLVAGSPDPWRPFLLGVALQVRGLRATSSIDPADASRATVEADSLLAEAHRLYPAHPLILEHWIALKFDRGDVADGFRLIDRMETIIPAEADPYLLRVTQARRYGIAGEWARGVESGKKRLRNKELQRFLDVVN